MAILNGNSLSNTLSGGAGPDTIFGREGNDFLVGNQGADVINGGPGSDVIDGGSGDDNVRGDGVSRTSAPVTSSAQGVIPSTGQALAIQLTMPDASNSNTISVSGLVSARAITQSNINIALIVDVSGSTSSGYNGTPVGDLNNDSIANTVLDGEIAGAIALLESIRTQNGFPNASVALIAFDSTAQRIITTTVSADADNNGVVDVETALRGLSDGFSTRYETALSEAVSYFQSRTTGQNFVFFLSDGAHNGGDYTPFVATLLDPNGIDATIRTFGIASQPALQDLDRVDDGQLNGSATFVSDPGTLSAAINGGGVALASIVRVEILVNGVLQATIPAAQLVSTPLGFSFNTALTGLNTTSNDVVTARVVASDPASTTVSTSQTLEQILPQGNDVIVGGVGNDALYGDGGNDTISGGDGNDILDGGSGGDRLVGGAGIDRLFGGAGVDYLDGGDDADYLNGGADNDVVLGGLGGDNLDGGLGVDDLSGGFGDDVYYVDTFNDIVREFGGQGTLDQVLASASYSLTGGAAVERLGTQSQLGTASITLIGNEFGQQLLGNNGNNTLVGGAGVDSFIGYRGNDIYVVDRANEQIVEAVGQGQDSVFTSISFTLGAGDSIELFAAVPQGATSSLRLIGNEFGQVIRGNNGATTILGGAGADSLYGFGGRDWLEGQQGNDALYGGTDVDSFVFRQSLGIASGVDRIFDFTTVDIIRIDSIAVTSARALLASEFVLGTTALDANDRVMYDQASGTVYFDPDGNGAATRILFAVLDSRPAFVTAGDFVLF